jgi:hypothetical protein
MSATADPRARLPQRHRDAEARTSPVTAHRLTPAGRTTAANHLLCDLTLRRSLHDPYPQIVCYQAAFTVVCRHHGSTASEAEGSSPGRYCPQDIHVLHQLARATAAPRPADPPHEIQVGSASIVVLPTWDQATFDALDDQSWELAAFSHLLRSGYYEILAELRGRDPRADPAAVASVDPSVVLVDQAIIEPPWRGLRLGLIGTGLALRELRRRAAFAVLYPMQPWLLTNTERTASHQHLTRYWSELGFTHRHEDHLVLDLSSGDLDAGLSRLTKATSRSGQ